MNEERKEEGMYFVVTTTAKRWHNDDSETLSFRKEVPFVITTTTNGTSLFLYVVRLHTGPIKLDH